MKKPGPPPTRFHIEGDWESAVKKAMSVKPPPKAGPQPRKKKPGRK